MEKEKAELSAMPIAIDTAKSAKMLLLLLWNII
jgi:hypothetical protein